MKLESTSSVYSVLRITVKERGILRIKTFYAWSEKSMDKKVNEFLEEPTLEIIDIKFPTPVFYFCAMVMYKRTAYSKNI